MNELAELPRLAPDLPIREKIFALQEVMVRTLEEADLDREQELAKNCPLKHFFAPGGQCKHVYAREIFIPAGMVIVGKIHKHAHLNMLMKGHVAVLTEKGREEFSGPLTMVSQAGTKRAVYAIEDSIWVTVHLTNDTDLKSIEEEIIAKDFDELERFLALEEKT
jgi:hypothetical protein